jgi:NADH dehydrogenase [ubiquinone] 1 alpha subcomplex assembly factor 7
LSRDDLRRRLAERGAMSVAAFMGWCLTERDDAYYRAADPIGRTGDFITAPEVSQIFGELIGLWAGAVWQSMRQPAPILLVELGPGRGTLMSDALRALAVVPDFLKSVQLHLVEQSERLRRRQHDALSGRFAPVWHENLSDVPDGPMIVIANEFVDALPLTQYIHAEDGWHERVVTMDAKGDAVFAAGAPATLPEIATLLSAPEIGEILESRLSAVRLIEDLGRRARDFPVAALIVDYGYNRDAFGDTLQAVQSHGYVDALTAPGESDLSAHVNFAELARMAAANDLASWGPMPQGEFLLALGLEARLQRLIASPRPEPARTNLVLGGRRLIDPYQMGELFKAMVLTSPGLLTPPPFARAEPDSPVRKEG